MAPLIAFATGIGSEESDLKLRRSFYDKNIEGETANSGVFRWAAFP
jgi:hypothetical protein